MSGAESLDLQAIFDNFDPQGREIANHWSSWNSARIHAKERWKETTQYIYATSTRETQGGDIGGLDEDDEGWSHSTHIPKITQIYDNLVANYMAALMPHDEWFKYIGEDQESSIKDKREVVEAYLRTKHRVNGFRTVVQQLVNDWVLYGNCFAHVSYESETFQDPQDEELTKKGYVGPVISRVSPYDIVFNPLASSFENSPKIIRTLKTLGELQRDIEDKPELGYEQEIFDKVVKARNTLRQVNTEDFDKNTQLTFDGFGTPSQYLQSGYVEILEFYGDMYDQLNGKFLKNHVITVVDRSFVIRSEPLKTNRGRPNLYHVGWRLRQDNLWAMGPMENLVGMQYMINHLENARADAFDQMIAPTRILVGDVENHGAESGVPGGEYRIPAGEGGVTNLAPDTTVLTADTQINLKTQQMEEYAGSPRQTMGFKAPGEQTAQEATILDRGASRIFQNKISYFEEEFLEKLLNAELEVARRNLDQSDIVSVTDEYGASVFLDITSDDLNSNGKLVPIGARHFARQNQLAGNLQMLTQAFSIDPLMQQHFPSLKMADLYAELLELGSGGIVQPYGRISEQAEAQKKVNVAETQVASEDQIPVGDEDEQLEETPVEEAAQ